MQNPALPALTDLIQRLAGSQHRGLLLVQTAESEPSGLLEWPASCAVLSNHPGYTRLTAYRQALGLNNLCVVIDCRDEINADAIAALCGTIVAEGVLVLLLPATLTPFLQRLVAMRPTQASALVTLTPDVHAASPAIPTLPQAAPFEALSSDQHAALQQLTAHLNVPQPALLHAPRGRGKSTLLGHLCAQASALGRRVFVSAPSKHQAKTLYAHAEALIPDEQQMPVFIAPDALISNSEVGPRDVLIVDEAASLPRHMLERIVAHYPQVIMATTTDGYEGCGRGFVLQFCADLQARFDAFTTVTLTTPQRWAANCPLEDWLNKALLLPHDSQTRAPSPPNGAVHYQYAHASELTSTALQQCFQLLLDAHYQTTPNDLKMLLDDPKHSLILQRQGAALVGVAWLAEEGELSETLSDDIWQGRRRPPGNLLAQSLTYYLRDRAAAQASLIRVVRIAVAPDTQRQGLGSELLRICVEQADSVGAAAIGTSFGLAANLIRFWCRNSFLPVRIGSKRDTVSARYSALFIRPLNGKWERKVKRWSELLRYHLAPLLLQTPLPPSVVNALGKPAEDLPPPPDYDDFAAAMIADFSQGHIDFSSVQPVLLRALDEDAPALLRQAARSRKTLSEEAKDHGFDGRKDYVKSLRQICQTLGGRI
ncbi:GNAT family N-acetyltransferase [Aliidiomarina sp. Khilg15.8]